MNEYEALYAEICDQTEAGSLCWKQIPRHANAEIILNAEEVLRQYEATFHRHGQAYKLLLLDKRHKEINFLFRKFELREPELHVMHEGELLTSLNQLHIDPSQLGALLGAVEPQSNLTRGLLGKPKANATARQA